MVYKRVLWRALERSHLEMLQVYLLVNIQSNHDMSLLTTWCEMSHNYFFFVASEEQFAI